MAKSILTGPDLKHILDLRERNAIVMLMRNGKSEGSRWAAARALHLTVDDFDALVSAAEAKIEAAKARKLDGFNGGDKMTSEQTETAQPASHNRRDWDALVRRAVELLGERGPLRRAALVEAVGIPDGSWGLFSKALGNCPEIELRRNSRYDLTVALVGQPEQEDDVSQAAAVDAASAESLKELADRDPGVQRARARLAEEDEMDRTHDARIIAELKSGGIALTRRELIDRCGEVGRAWEVMDALERLLNAGRVVKTGRSSGTRYLLVEQGVGDAGEDEPPDEAEGPSHEEIATPDDNGHDLATKGPGTAPVPRTAHLVFESDPALLSKPPWERYFDVLLELVRERPEQGHLYGRIEALIERFDAES